ncbi:winged helix-turn-helix domain-containing protein [Streptomyces sp. MAA16]|uniref:winged helix-turn-helix domain-containing protein n=1 Tax=Streptomyces sp. MAA16 TaxID=3035116 RepID=UPI0024743FCE|nr:winged helix-turn-helix domain-containing protein [Streptomyces sp. MAA16]MDH6700442.1 DNA-binding transcriptional ArsR family regulator [Streptomyces sp. MAA16]
MSVYDLAEAPVLPTTDQGTAACLDAPAPFDSLVMAKGTPSAKLLATAAGICGSCPLNTTCSARVHPAGAPVSATPDTRTAVTTALAAAPPDGMTPTQIREATGLGQTAVYKALKALLGKGLARKARHGRYLPATTP